MFHAADGNYDLLIVSLGLENFDALRLCSQVRSLDRTRNLPILAVTEPDNNARMVRGLEIGVNDYLMRPIDKNELLARARTPGAQAPLHRAAARQRADVDRNGDHRRADRPVQPPLHGEPSRHADRAGGRPAASRWRLLVLDIDFFKSINDTHGHDAGDDVLRDFALRIKRSIRGIDLACRYGGEEFVIIMPETDMAVAAMVAERLRRRIAAEPFAIDAARAPSRSRSRSASRRCAGATTMPRPCSNAPTRRSTGPSATAATGSCPTRRRAFFR